MDIYSYNQKTNDPFKDLKEMVLKCILKYGHNYLATNGVSDDIGLHLNSLKLAISLERQYLSKDSRPKVDVKALENAVKELNRSQILVLDKDSYLKDEP